MHNSTTIILHSPETSTVSADSFKTTLRSVKEQLNKNFDLIILGKVDDNNLLDDDRGNILQIEGDSKNQTRLLNEAIKISDAEFLLYIDNREKTIVLKRAALDAFLMAAVRNTGSGMFYADYDLEEDQTNQEIKLLFHHRGRVRDNQDYGKVFFFTKKALEKVSFFDESLQYNALYDNRLKISEYFNLTRISNKFGGSLYKVLAKGQKANVFDYLLAGKDVQLEAEEIVTSHLKRIHAYLKPADFMPTNNNIKDVSTLDASVIIPVGFRPGFIGTAIESIQAQTISTIEAIIVVNGGKDDPTVPVVEKYMKGGPLYNPEKPEVRLLVIDINSIGLCINLGVNMARGKYYVQLDSDDRLKPDAVEKILDAFNSSRNIGMVIGSYEVWEQLESGKFRKSEQCHSVRYEEWTEDNGRNNLLRINGAGAPRAIPVTVIKEMGYFGINDDAYARNYGEDYEMVNKISEHYKVGRIYDPVYEVIRHAGGTDHAISQDVVDRNDEAKDDMRLYAIRRRIAFNTGKV